MFLEWKKAELVAEHDCIWLLTTFSMELIWKFMYLWVCKKYVFMNLWIYAAVLKVTSKICQETYFIYLLWRCKQMKYYENLAFVQTSWSTNCKEPVVVSDTLQEVWQGLAAALFEHEGSWCLLIACNSHAFKYMNKALQWVKLQQFPQTWYLHFGSWNLPCFSVHLEEIGSVWICTSAVCILRY